jgi:hypothetical protein
LHKAPYINCPQLSQTSKHHLQSSPSLIFKIDIKPWFLTEGKRATILIIPSSWGSQRAGHSPHINDAPYKYEVYDILKFCFDNYKEENGYILKYLNRCSPPTEETNVLQEPMEEEIAETGSTLDEKEESEDQEEEEWSNYPCLPPNKSNSLTNTLFDRPPCLPKEDEYYIDNCDDPTILELDMDYVLADHENHALCDIYIVEFVHAATENYYERGKYGCWSFHVTKTPLFILNVPKLLLFYLPMLVTMCFFDLFSYNIPMHRKWVRLKCVSYFLLDSLFCYNSYFLCDHLLKLPSLVERH